MNLAKVIMTITSLLLLSGCTQIITAPISVAGAVVGATADVVGSVGGAAINSVKGGKE